MRRLPRRQFLKRCGGVSAAAFLPSWPLRPAEPNYFHLHPTYREQTPLDPILEKRSPLLDRFPLEKEHEGLATLLAEWSTDLRQTSPSINSIARDLAPDFAGSSLEPRETKVLRPDHALHATKIEFDSAPSLRRERFLDTFSNSLREFSTLETVDLQVTRIERSDSDHLTAQIRYELVGTGSGFFREGRTGTWQLEWRQSPGGRYQVLRWRQLTEIRSRSAAPVFADVTANAFGRNASYREQLLHGVDHWRTILDGACHIDIYGHNGVAVGRAYGSAFDDVYICQPSGLPNRLYRNRGDGTFEDVTAGAGVGVLENTACALFADFRNSGQQDLLVVRAEGPLLFVNDGDGRFRRQPDAFRFADAPEGTFTGAAAADYDRDGWLDVYFCLYVYYQGAGQYKYPVPYFDANNGPPNFLMRNNRDGTFRDATAECGLNRNNTRYSFCCGWTDVDGDGWPDLYVVNDFGRKNLYRNNGDGIFTDVAAETHVEDVGAGMSVCFFDYDNDGREDLYVADMATAAGERITAQDEFKSSSAPAIRAQYRKHAMGNSLFHNERPGSFADRTASAAVGDGRWSWSSDAWDFDHDGFQDLYVTNGMVSGPLREDLNSFFWRQVVANSPDAPKLSRDYEQGWTAINELIRADYSWSGYERNVFFASNRDGTFSDVSAAIALDFLEDGRAFALSDIDGDGRLEIILKNRNGPQVRVLKNVLEDLPPAISFRLTGTKSNRDAIGARIEIETSISRQIRTLQAGSGFLSQHGKELVFGLGAASGPIKASVRWPNGLIQSFDNLPRNHRVLLTEGSHAVHTEPFSRTQSFVGSPPRQAETLPISAETWMLVPVMAPDFALADRGGTAKRLSDLRGVPVLLYLTATGLPLSLHRSPQICTVALNLLDLKNADIAAVYNILYRTIFDRHRNLTLPVSLLLDETGAVVRIYREIASLNDVRQDLKSLPRSRSERIAKALPFARNADTFSFGRNYLSLGSVYFQRGYMIEAASAFASALGDDPSSAEACYGLGSVYLKQADLSRARENFNQAVRLPASYPETKTNAWNNLGLIAIRENHPDQAVDYFLEGLKLQPEHLISLLNLGNAYRVEKRWSDAEAALARALALSPDDPEVNYSLGMVFAQLNRPDRAYTLLAHALQQRPNYPEAMNNLGVLYLRTQRRDDAVRQFKKCMEVAPAFDQSYLNLARVYLIEGHRDEARATLKELLNHSPGNEQARRALSELP